MPQEPVSREAVHPDKRLKDLRNPNLETLKKLWDLSTAPTYNVPNWADVGSPISKDISPIICRDQLLSPMALNPKP